MRRLLAFIVLVVIALGGVAYWWLHAPLSMTGAGTQALELAIEPGTTARGVARDVVAAGVKTDARLLYAWFRVSGQDRAIKAGNYEIPPGTTPISLLQKLARGEEALRAFTLVEGWNWRQVRQALAREDQLQPDSARLTDEALMAQLGRPGGIPRGGFFRTPMPMPRVRATSPCCAGPCTPWTAASRPLGRSGPQTRPSNRRTRR